MTAATAHTSRAPVVAATRRADAVRSCSVLDLATSSSPLRTPRGTALPTVRRRLVRPSSRRDEFTQASARVTMTHDFGYFHGSTTLGAPATTHRRRLRCRNGRCSLPWAPTALLSRNEGGSRRRGMVACRRAVCNVPMYIRQPSVDLYTRQESTAVLWGL